MKTFVLTLIAFVGLINHFSCFNGHDFLYSSPINEEKMVYYQDYTKSFPQYGFSITAPCELEDVSSQSSGNFLLNLGGVTDGNDPAKMVAYQLALIRVPVGYKDLPKEEYERMMDNYLRSLGRSFRYWNHISFGYEGYNGYVGETTHNGYGQKGVMFVKDNLVIALTVITNNNLEQKFNKFTNGFKAIK